MTNNLTPEEKEEFFRYMKEFYSTTFQKIEKLDGTITDISIQIDQVLPVLMKDIAELRAEIWRLKNK